MLQIKILFKTACALKWTWDDVLNDQFIEKWNKFFKELENLTPIKVGRYLFTNHLKHTQHRFMCDDCVKMILL